MIDVAQDESDQITADQIRAKRTEGQHRQDRIEQKTQPPTQPCTQRSARTDANQPVEHGFSFFVLWFLGSAVRRLFRLRAQSHQMVEDPLLESARSRLVVNPRLHL